jgi:hypothetical protein
MLQLEALIYGIPSGYAAERVSDLATPRTLAVGVVPDLIVNVTGRRITSRNAPMLSLSCNGDTVERGGLNAILMGSVPYLRVDLIQAGSGSRQIAGWPVAIEDHKVANRALGNILGRAVQVLVQAASALSSGKSLDGLILHVATMPDQSGNRSAIAAFVAETLLSKVQGRLKHLVTLAPNWSVGWRSVAPDDGAMADLHGKMYHRLTDDGQRFYADPFPWNRDGRAYVFMEEYPYATSRGIISVSQLIRGKLTTPQCVLEQDVHLSYPFLVEEQGVIYMIPETSSRDTVELWRCISFPNKWELNRILISGENLTDVTLIKKDETWFMFASQKQRWTSSWDALAIWWAPSLFGPWVPHPANPVVVDVRAARPAGNLLYFQGRLLRPAQNCADRYGAALTIAVVEGVSRLSYRQTVVGAVRPTPPFVGLHTYNRSANIEVVDIFGNPNVQDFTVQRSEM